jgi:uncharacterized protein YndB with AHSA1/START domain
MTETASITVQREIPAPAKELFDLLSNPHRHTDLDGSGFVRGLDRGDRITKVGQQFRMNMTGDHMGGEYQTDNVITGFDPDKMIAWQTAPAGKQPPGWEWLWELKPESADATEVTLTYDWRKVTDQALLDKVGFPLVSESQLEDSLNKLAELAAS